MGGCVPRGEPKKSAPGWGGDTKSPPRPGAHNAIIADLALPVVPAHAAGGHGCAVYSSSVTDAQWAILVPLLPAPGSTAGRGGRPEKDCRRVIVAAILYIVRGGIGWRQLPMEFPPAATASAVFARWGGSILDALRDRLPNANSPTPHRGRSRQVRPSRGSPSSKFAAVTIPPQRVAYPTSFRRRR